MSDPEKKSKFGGRIAGILGLVAKTAARYAVGRARHGVADGIDHQVQGLYRPYTRGTLGVMLAVSVAVALVTTSVVAIVAGVVLLIVNNTIEPMLVGGLILLIGGVVLGLLTIILMAIVVAISWHVIEQASRRATDKIRGD